MLTPAINLTSELERFRAKLLDLSLRNPLLNYRVSKRKTLQLDDESPDDVFRRLVLQEKSMLLLPDLEMDTKSPFDGEVSTSKVSHQPLLDLADLAIQRKASSKRRHADNQLQTNLGTVKFQSIARGMSRDTKTSIEETGINYLHLAVGFLRWRESESSEGDRMAPLVLIPVEIRTALSAAGGYEFHVSWNEDDVQANPSLQKKLQYEFGITLPDFSDEQLPSEYFELVSRAIQNKSSWSVDEQMLLGFFSFHKLSMYMDIDPQNWAGTQALSESSIASQLVIGSTEGSGSGLYSDDYDVDDHGVAKTISLPLDADSSQHSAVADIVDGKNMVIEGPPGTGKSQTIANAIANAIERGKTVLFVAEKLAALEVVYKRLSQAGLSHFCLELHGHSVAPKKVMESLALRLGSSDTSRKESTDSLRRLEECKTKLYAYLRASSKQVGPYKEPLYDLFWRIVRLRQNDVPLRRDLTCDSNVKLDAFEDACEALTAFSKQSEGYERPTASAWWGFFPRDLAPTEAARVLEQLERLVDPATSLDRSASELLGLFDQDTIRLQKFLSGKDQHALEQLAQDAPKECAIPFVKLADNRFCEQIELLEQTHRRADDAYLELDHQLVDREQSLPSLLGVFDKPSLIRLSQFPPQTSLADLNRIQTWAEQTRSLLELHKQRIANWSSLGLQSVTRLQDIDRSLQITHLMQHSAMAGQESVGADWFLDSIRKVLSRIKSQSQALTKRKEEISKVFHLPSVPERSVLVESIRKLRSTGGSWLSWFNRDYRSVTKEIRAFSKFPSNYSFAKRLAALESLECFDKDAQLFQSDSSNLRVLGSLNRGLETDWDLVKTQLDWVATARNLGLDHSKTNSLLRVRTELANGTSIQNLKLEYQQLIEQLSSNDARLVGIDSNQISSLRIEDVERLVTSVISPVTQAITFADQLKNRSTATIQSLLHAYTTAITYFDSKSKLKSLCDNSDSELQTAADFVLRRGGSFGSTIDWLRGFQKIIQDSSLVSSLDTLGAAKLAETLSSSHKAIWRSVKQWDEIRDSVIGNAEIHDSWLSATSNGVPRLDLTATLDSIRNENVRLPTWLSFCRTYERCRRAGVEAFAMAASKDEIADSQLADSYRLALFNQNAESELSTNEIGFHFTTREIEDIRSNFQRFDRDSMQSTSIRIDRIARQKYIPEGIGRGRVSELTELALIRHEIGKKSRHCKIRELMRRAGNAIQGLKPCFLMSPLSLARYIRHDALDFDIVIMDEASQIKPEDAMGAILRAKQMVVVGDPKQLPPTSFFDQSAEELDDEEATQFDNAESVLEVAQRAFQPYRRLRWHYRSQHESLIQFSNQKFYDEDLIVFPSPKGVLGGYGIQAHFVEGASCVKGENVKEAEAVVAKIIDHAKLNPSESLGVAAFNQKQAELINGLLEAACDKDSDLAKMISNMKEGDDGFFVKNLESIQGDERDVIFISYTYGPDPSTGRVFQRFGPINSVMGWRRLNVMVTRSRKRMEVFSSLHPSQIQTGPDKSRGVNAYHDFLEFAHSGMLRETGSESGREPDSPFEESVARIVDACGLEPVFQVGVAGYFIDIGVRRREGNREFLLGIECDGATYHSSRSARDRDRLREEIIKARGWRLHRIWSTEWFLNQRAEEERLRKLLCECSAAE
ncbi:MAG: DUF4011 domain-containing protein [Planctomycetota bacterium]